ncbi:MAG: hypothetical protein ABUJ92_01155 [Desulfobacterales bacterium]
MILRVQRKGKKVLMEESELQEYMSAKLQELAGLFSNVVTALILVSLVVVFNFIKAKDFFYYALFLLPLIGRYYIGNMIIKWLRKIFKELLDN